MALLGNCSVLHKSPAKYTTGTVGFNDRANWNKPGMMRSRGNLTLSTLWKYDAVPSGMMAGRAWFPPQTAGRIVSRSGFSIDASGSGAMGLPGAAAAGFSIDATAIGGLIAGGIANASITISASASIAGLASGQASASMSISASAVSSAFAWGVATGVFSVTATATAYGRGFMRASTVDNSVMTPLSITQAVLNALAADYNTSGTIGAKINSAASGGVDYAALGQGVWDILTTPGSATAGSMGARLVGYLDAAVSTRNATKPPTAASVATAVLSAAQTTPIVSNTVAIKGQSIGGTGSEIDPWGPA